MPKIQNIEFLRFLMAEILVFFHLRDYLFRPLANKIAEYKMVDIALRDGEKVVDFFFIISGFFLVYTLKDISTFDYVKGKLARLLPAMLFCACLYFLESTLSITRFDFLQTVLSDLFMFNSTGLVTSKGSMTAVWFVCVLFWVSLFYFYLIRYFDQKHVYLIISLITWLGYTMLFQSGHGSANGNSITIVYSFVSKGLLRGLSGVGLGCLIAFFYLARRKRGATRRSVYFVLCSVLEIFCLLWLLSHMTFYKNPIQDDLVCIVLFTMLFTLFLHGKGVVSSFLNNKYSVLLGRYSFSLFISHGLFLRLVRYVFPNTFVENFYILTPLLILCICSIFAVMLHHFIEVPGARLIRKLLFFSADGGNLPPPPINQQAFCYSHAQKVHTTQALKE